jgi:adenosylcobinamide kinase/adenosylcobinamide-phosphate guanylyltransferase
LRTAGAEIVVVAPALSQSVADLAARGLITTRRRGYVAADLDGAWLALACTNRRQVDAAVVADAGQRRIWCVAGEDSTAVPGTAQATAAQAEPERQLEPARIPASRPTGRPARAARAGRRVLVLGGARSGKSVRAEAMLASYRSVDYIATGQATGTGDPAWDARIHDHQQRRPAYWRTTETLELCQVLDGPGAAVPVLIDCLSTWLAGVMDECGLWSEGRDADKQVAARLDTLVESWRATHCYVVAVSNEVGSGVVPATVSGVRFRDELGALNARIAAECQEVWLCTAGIARRLR